MCQHFQGLTYEISSLGLVELPRLGLLIGNDVLELEEETRRCGDYQLLMAMSPMRLPWFWSEVAVNTAENNTYVTHEPFFFLPTCHKYGKGWLCVFVRIDVKRA